MCGGLQWLRVSGVADQSVGPFVPFVGIKGNRGRDVQMNGRHQACDLRCLGCRVMKEQICCWIVGEFTGLAQMRHWSGLALVRVEVSS